jgi:SAM-dependent methyltransferase
VSGSVRRRLQVNANDSKNTRMGVAQAGVVGDWRVDVLAHMSRYSKLAHLLIKESQQLGRPVDCLEVGCGELWVLAVLYKAYQVKKSDVIKSYMGVDIDPAVLEAYERLPEMFKEIGAQVRIQDLTVNPTLPCEPGSVDVFWSTEVIEHMKPEFIPAWLDSAHTCLRPGGLIYISTPNADGSHEKLPADHVYEWGYQELRAELLKRWRIVSVTGTFIQLPKFEKVNVVEQRIPSTLVEFFEARFDQHWLRNVLAASYPEISNNVAWVLRKPNRTPVR